MAVILLDTYRELQSPDLRYVCGMGRCYNVPLGQIEELLPCMTHIVLSRGGQPHVSPLSVCERLALG